ncbi:MAG: hypothetical protein LBK12_09050 [Odoribacteraceae bacterium]|nr:hypothetical protein [Odoribacteraceae bacterium]
MKRLSDVVENEELFKAYPELDNVAVILGEVEGGHGSYSHSGKVITLDRNSIGRGDMLSVMVHEIQHAIQGIEGFARGGNERQFSDPGEWELAYRDFDDNARKLDGDKYENIGRILNDEDFAWYRKMLAGDVLDGMRYMYGEMSREMFMDNYEDFVKNGKKGTAFQQYRRISGEVEARNAQRRMDMTEEERRATLAAETEDVAREDQVFLYDGAGVSEARDLESSRESHNFAESNEVNHGISDRSSQEKRGGGIQVHGREKEVAAFIAGRLEAARAELQGQLSREGGGSRELSSHEVEDVEKRAVLDYAKDHGLWVEDLYSLGAPFAGGGNENTLAYDEASGVIYKSNNLFNSQNSVANLLDQVAAHNQLFPWTRYDLVGFTGIDNGGRRAPYIEVILRQRYVPDAVQATPGEIAGFMRSLGFERVNDHTFTNGEFRVSDLRPRNVLKDENGSIHVVDDIVTREDEKGESAGQLTGAQKNEGRVPIADSGALEGPAGTLGDRASRTTDVLPRTTGPVNESGDEGTGISGNNKGEGENSAPPPPGNGGTRFQAAGNEGENPGTTRAREELVAKLDGRGWLGRMSNKAREAYQDGLIAVKRFEELLREKGVEIPDSDDFYLQATAVPGRIDAALAAYRKRFHEPLMAAIGALEKAGFSRREVENYAMLKHGMERDAFMAAEDEKAGRPRRKDYSGVSAIEKEVGMPAAEFVAGFEERAGEELVGEFWKRARAATGNATRAYYRGGLMSREQLQALGDRYAYFIPLRGHDDVTAEDVYDYGRDAGEWFVNPLAAAKGRSSRAATPFAYIEGMNATAIRAAGRNLHRQAFARMAGRDKTGLTTVSRQWYVKGIDGNGAVTWEARWPEYSEDAGVYARNISEFEENMARLEEKGDATTREGKLDVGGLFIKPKQAKHHAVPVMVNGSERVVYVNGDPRVAEAATGMNVAETGGVVTAAKDVSRFMSANFTTRNPMFVVSNFSRDTLLATSMAFVKEGGKYTGAFVKNLPVAWGEMRRYLSGQGSAVVAEFIANGGKTGYSRLLEVRDLARRMEREAAGGGRWDENKVTRFLQAVNDWAENVNRVAVYVTSREAGRSVARSISDAKEITVNFNRSGSGHAGARYMNALYLFSNVAIQALDNFAGAARRHPGRATGLLLAYGTWGFLTPVLIQLLGGDDDLEEYLGLPEWDRKNNWCISVGSGVIKVPLPQELRVFHGVGAGVFSCVTGQGDWEREFYLTLGGLIDLAPYNVSNLSTSWAEALPDAARPVGQILANRTFTGSPVYNEHADGHLPGFKQARVNRRGEAYADDWLIEFAGAVDAMTGGDGVRRGVVSPNPDVLNQLGKGYLGGLFETAAFAFEVARKTGGALAGEGFSLGARETPGRRFFSDYGDNAAGGSGLQGDFFRARERVEEAVYLLKGYAGDRAAGRISLEEWEKHRRELAGTAALGRAVEAVVQAEGMIKRLPRERQKEMEERVAGAKRRIVNYEL